MDYCKCEGGAACHNQLITRPTHNEDNVLYDSTYGCQLKIYLLTKKMMTMGISTMMIMMMVMMCNMFFFDYT